MSVMTVVFALLALIGIGGCGVLLFALWQIRQELTEPVTSEFIDPDVDRELL